MCLVLSRKVGESIVVNHDTTVTISEVRGDKVRLAISAPKAVPVNRAEVEALLNRPVLDDEMEMGPPVLGLT
jgi:carbon storage regulator CsrA